MKCSYARPIALVSVVILVMSLVSVQVSGDPSGENFYNYFGSHANAQYNYDGWQNVDSSMSLGNYYYHWDPDDYWWEVTCKMDGGFKDTGVMYPGSGTIQSAAFDIRMTYRSDNGFLDTINNADLIWSTLESNQTNNMSVISAFLVDMVLSCLGGFGASLFWSVSDNLIANMSNGYDGLNSTSQSIWVSWNWNPRVDEANQFLRYDVMLHSGETVVVKSYYHIFQPFFEISTCGPISLTYTSPGDDPPHLSPAERDEYGIVVVAREDLLDYSSSHGLDPDKVQRYLSQGCDEHYFIEDLKKYVSVGSAYPDLQPSENDHHIADCIKQLSWQTADYGLIDFLRSSEMEFDGLVLWIGMDDNSSSVQA